MSEIIALVVHFIPVRNNFVYLHSKLLPKFKNSSNPIGCIEIKHDQNSHYGSCYSTPFNANGENSFNISASYANSLSIKEHETVIISSVDNLKSLKSVHVTPLSSDDWDILENSAETVQSNLLNQIRVVSIHQNLVIWVSKSISLKIHIDYINDDNYYGKLEQFTEVIVSTEVKQCAVCSSSENNFKPNVGNAWNFSFFKDIFSLIKPKEVLEKEESNHVLETEFHCLGIFRYILLDSLQFKSNTEFLTHPYNVFLSKKYVKNSSILNGRKSSILCRLTYIPFITAKPSKEEKAEKIEINPILSGDSTREIYVHLFILDDLDLFEPNSKFHSMNSYPTIYVSHVIQQLFSSNNNAKTKLDIITTKPLSPCLTEINFSFLEYDADDFQEEKYAEEIKNYFTTYTLARDTVVINNHLIHNTFHDHPLCFSFNPANIPFVEMSSDDVEKCCFKYVNRKSSIKLNKVEKLPIGADLLSFSFFRNIIDKLKCNIFLELGFLSSQQNKVFFANSNKIMIEGDHGCGKTSLMRILSDELTQSDYGIFIKTMECKSLKGKLVGKLKKIFEFVLRECVYHQPSVLILDDLDALFVTSKQNTQTHSERSVSSYTNRLSIMLADLIRSCLSHRVTVLATATNLSFFEPNLYQARGASIFSIKLQLSVLDQDMREEALTKFLLAKYNLSLSKRDYLEKVIQRLEGYCIQDIADLVDRIYFEVIKRQVKSSQIVHPAVLLEEDIDRAISELVPLSLKGVDFHKDSIVTWKNVGGLDIAKQTLTEILIWPSKYPKIFEQCPLKMQSGVLLYGAPGSGKTLLAAAVAGESALNFISIKGPELLSKFVGESEEGVRNTFRRAQNAKPCILFFDEFESLAPRRGNDITGVTDRVVNQLLTELDGVESVSGVWVLAATSRPDLIDPALLRPGRLGSVVFCPLPNQNDRLSILKIICESTEMHPDVDLNKVAQITEGFTGADLQAILYTAHMSSSDTNYFDDDEDISQNLLKTQSQINMECLIEAVKATKPSLKLEERLSYEKIYQRFSQRSEKVDMDLENQRLTYA